MQVVHRGAAWGLGPCHDLAQVPTVTSLENPNRVREVSVSHLPLVDRVGVYAEGFSDFI